MRILIATDAWKPQVNGVVRTYESLKRELEAQGHTVTLLTPLNFPTVPFPGYPEIRLALPRFGYVRAVIDSGGFDHVHIATEGPIGWATRAACRRRRVGFTTSFHTRFPEYVKAYTGLPTQISYAFLRYFHGPALATLVATRSLKRDLKRRGFKRLALWARGVDTEHFRPRPDLVRDSRRPVFLYVGRVSREKNIEAFLNLDLPGQKVVVGDGPRLSALRQEFPGVSFKGAKSGDELAREYSSADVFVFPSLTDTFGLVLLEAMASGLPSAAFPVTGPIDVLTPGLTGVLSDDLRKAAIEALALDRDRIRKHALRLDWSRVADIFLATIYDARRARETERKRARARRIPVRGIKPSAKPTA